MKQGSAWNAVKMAGKAGIPKGDAQSDFAELSNHLERIGIYLVGVGEAEDFCREFGSHVPRFVNKLLTEVRFDDGRLEALRRFVNHVYNGPRAP